MKYQSPSTIKEAVALLKKERGKAYVLAGGTDLLVGMKMGTVEPDLVVDIKRIPALNAIKATKTGFRIGAAVSCAELGEHKALTKAWPGVVEAANLIGSDQVQGRCTIVGNLCNASPAADSVPALMAAGAKAVIVGSTGRRTVRVEDVATGPGQTCLKRGDVIEAITLTKPAKGTGDAYLRFIPRTEMDIAVVGAGICLTLEDGVVTKARVALGAVAPTALLVPEAADALIGTKVNKKALENLAAACSAACRPIDDKRGTAEYPNSRRYGRARSKNRLQKGGEQKMSNTTLVSTNINGDLVEFACPNDETLLDALRNRVGLTGSKEGCGTGDCGACSVTLDGRLVCSCLVLGVEADGREVGTIEGLTADGELHLLQEKFIEHAALQCGICTPGILVAAKALLDKNPEPTETEVRYALAGNLCRCTGYDKIVRAVQATAKDLQKSKKKTSKTKGRG